MSLLQIYYARFVYVSNQECNLLLSALICMEDTKGISTFDLNPEVQNKNEKEIDAKVKSKVAFKAFFL